MLAFAIVVNVERAIMEKKRREEEEKREEIKN
jgi:hypothetical protein